MNLVVMSRVKVALFEIQSMEYGEGGASPITVGREVRALNAVAQ